MTNITEMRMPMPYEQTKYNIWTEPHLAKQMLKAHLKEDFDGATRNMAFVKRSAKWIGEIAPPAQSPKLLDLGCGPGIYCRIFNDMGYDVTGLDFSESSIAYARSKNRDINYVCGNYLSLDEDEKYDVITLIYCDFGVLSPKDKETLLGKVFKALKPGGKFIMDVWSKAYFDAIEERESLEERDGGYWNEKPHTLSFISKKYGHNTWVERYVVQCDGQARDYNVWNTAFSQCGLKTMLLTKGFDDIEIYSDCAGSIFSEESKTLCAVALKKML